jgi:NAD+ synthase (glutamine-hydrolysing)
VLNNGKIETQRFKSLLPTYDIFDEYRYFEPNHEWQIVEIKGERIALTICEDIWDKQPFAYVGAKGDLYQSSPFEYLSRQNRKIIVNIAASPFSYNQGIFAGKCCRKMHEGMNCPWFT